MKMQLFLSEFKVGNLTETAVLVHVHALESAGACSKGTQACPMHLKVLEEGLSYKS
jgi:hypothetical protein